MSNGSIQFEEIMIGKPPPFKIEYARVPIAAVNLDPANPRLTYRKQRDGFVNESPAAVQSTLREQLFEDNDTKHLKLDIKTNGLFERPIVRRDLMNDGAYVVFEGNRRVSCVKALNEDDADNPAWQTIEVRILPPEVSDEQRAVLLAQFHVAGKLKWNAHERAGHIYQMVEVLKLPDETVKTTLHMGKPAIDKAVAAYKMMKEFLAVDGGKFAGEGEGKFSFFHELQRIKQLRELAKNDPAWAADFYRWVGTGRIPRAEDVRGLASIYDDNVAYSIFRNEAEPDAAFAKAMAEVQRNDVTRKSRVFAKIQEMIDAIGDATLTDFATAAQPNGKKLLEDAHGAIQQIRSHAR